MKYFLIIFFYLFANQLLAGELPPAIISDDTQNFSLLKSANLSVFYPIDDKAFSFEEISSPDFDSKFIAFDKEKGLFPDKNIVWIRFAITNQSKANDWLLDLSSQYDSISLYITDNEKLLKMYADGLSIPHTQKVKYYGLFSYLPLDIPPNKTQIYYLRLQIYKPIALQNKSLVKLVGDINIQPEKVVASEHEQRKYFISGFAAVCMVMAFYTFALFLYFRDRSYLFFALTLIATGVVSFILLDALCAFLGFSKIQESYFYFIFILSPWLFLLLFSRSYLQLAKYAPAWDKTALVLIGIIILYYLLAIFDVWIGLATIAISLLSIVVTLFAGIAVSLKGYKPARYFLLANIFYLGGRFISALALFHIINSSSLAFSANIIGGIFQILFFAVGLLYRLEEMQKEIERGKEEKQKMIETQNERLENEVKARTNELQSSEEELRQNMEALQMNQEIIKNQRDRLETAFEELESKNLRITDSIRYAKRIQGAVLPHEDVLKNNFEEHLLIFHPKDVVSGDFYWYDAVADRKFLAVVDCTGHGVPGAFMSMIGNTLLDEIINSKHIFEPNLVLSQLHKSIIAALGGEGGHLQDGMDVVLCSIQAQENSKFLVEYSGAKRPIFYFSNGELKEEAGTKKSIGQTNTTTYFELHTFLMNKGDIIYLTTDGVTDIINPKRQRLGSQHFKEMLTRNAYLPLATQKEAFLQELDSFQENTEQRDDILFLAVKL